MCAGSSVACSMPSGFTFKTVWSGTVHAKGYYSATVGSAASSYMEIREGITTWRNLSTSVSTSNTEYVLDLGSNSTYIYSSKWTNEVEVQNA